MNIKYVDKKTTDTLSLDSRTDAAGVRMKALFELPDLTRTDRSPVRFVLDAVLEESVLAGCDIVEIPSIVPVETNFDLLNVPPDHPSRSKSDTFYIDAGSVLRTHTTVFQPYYLRDPSVLERLENDGCVTAVCYGKVYRRDEIDRCHYPVFHQVDGLRVRKKSLGSMTLDDISGVAVRIAKRVFGPDVPVRQLEDSFPFTHPSIQLEAMWGDRWLEVMGAGLVHKNVLAALGLDPSVYNGWAFGFGLDRLAMARMGIPDIRILWLDDERVTRQFTGLNSTYREVSRFPATDRDVSMLVRKDVSLNDIYETMRMRGRERGDEVIEEVKLLDQYDHPSFSGRTSLTFRIVYRSHLRTLTNNEVNEIQESVRIDMVQRFGAELR